MKCMESASCVTDATVKVGDRMFCVDHAARHWGSGETLLEHLKLRRKWLAKQPGPDAVTQIALTLAEVDTLIAALSPAQTTPSDERVSEPPRGTPREYEEIGMQSNDRLYAEIRATQPSPQVATWCAGCGKLSPCLSDCPAGTISERPQVAPPTFKWVGNELVEVAPEAILGDPQRLPRPQVAAVQEFAKKAGAAGAVWIWGPQVAPPSEEECDDDCPMCSGEACQKCGAGCWSSVQDCTHDVVDRHEPPATQPSPQVASSEPDTLEDLAKHIARHVTGEYEDDYLLTLNLLRDGVGCVAHECACPCFGQPSPQEAPPKMSEDHPAWPATEHDAVPLDDSQISVGGLAVDVGWPVAPLSETGPERLARLAAEYWEGRPGFVAPAENEAPTLAALLEKPPVSLMLRGSLWYQQCAYCFGTLDDDGAGHTPDCKWVALRRTAEALSRPPQQEIHKLAEDLRFYAARTGSEAAHATYTAAADALEALSRPPLDAEKVATEITREVAELGDRTSPDDWPEAMLVTADELCAIVVSAIREAQGEK